MKKILSSIAFIFAFAAYGLSQHLGNSANMGAGVLAVPSSQQMTTTEATVQPAPQQTPAATPPTPTKTPASTVPTAPAPKPAGQYVDGTYTGSAADAYYGTVQVSVTVSGGKLANVAFLQYPNDRSTSRYINSQAMPILKSEAVRAQSAQVSTVSGASDTSAAFRESLAAALSQAKS